VLVVLELLPRVRCELLVGLPHYLLVMFFELFALHSRSCIVLDVLLVQGRLRLVETVVGCVHRTRVDLGEAGCVRVVPEGVGRLLNRFQIKALRENGVQHCELGRLLLDFGAKVVVRHDVLVAETAADDQRVMTIVNLHF
jgi:hypothetical protein